MFPRRKTFEKSFKNPLTNPTPCGIINSVKWGQAVGLEIEFSPSPRVLARSLAKKLEKKFCKPLDKPHKVWYNKDAPKRSRKDRRRKTPQTRKENPYEE